MPNADAAPVQPANWRNRIVGEGEEAPDQLLANPRNWRVHPEHQQEALAGALSEVGWVQRVIVNRQTGCVVDGHLRIALALRHNAPSVPVLYVDLTEEEEAIVLATLDPIGAMARTDQAKLEELLADLGSASPIAAKVTEGLIQKEKVEGKEVTLDRRYVLLAFLPEQYEYVSECLDELGSVPLDASAIWFADMGVEPRIMGRFNEMVKDLGLRDVREALVQLCDAWGPA